MKSGVQQVVGKTVERVVVAKGAWEQVFLIFTDGTYFEFYGRNFSGAGGIDTGGLQEVIAYVACCSAEVKNVYPPTPEPSPSA